jgi:hypothetical protein
MKNFLFASYHLHFTPCHTLICHIFLRPIYTCMITNSQFHSQKVHFAYVISVEQATKSFHVIKLFFILLAFAYKWMVWEHMKTQCSVSLLWSFCLPGSYFHIHVIYNVLYPCFQNIQPGSWQWLTKFVYLILWWNWFWTVW